MPNVTSRRRLLTSAVACLAVAAAGGTAVELVSHGVLPGKAELDRLDGACAVGGRDVTFGEIGPSVTGSFYSAARGRVVGYEIGLPAGYRAGGELPLVVMLHGFGGDHRHALAGLTPAQAVAIAGLRPMAMVTVDGGNGYWNPHPGDDPMGMLVDELIPRCQRLGLGTGARRVGAMGISMGGYGALLLATMHPSLVRAVAAISPAVWTSYDQARAANAGAYASAADFAACDVVTHASALAGRVAVRVAAGYGDPFYPGVQALAAALPPGAVIDFGKGCHDGSFFASQQPAALEFLSESLA
jgi:pimeloyl-ACP methyl ester carboxylesterase